MYSDKKVFMFRLYVIVLLIRMSCIYVYSFYFFFIPNLYCVVYFFNSRKYKCNICMLFIYLHQLQKLEKRSAFAVRAFLSCFQANAKKLIFLPTMYIYCLYPAISKSVKQLPNFPKKEQKQHVSNHFQGYPLSRQPLYSARST